MFPCKVGLGIALTWLGYWRAVFANSPKTATLPHELNPLYALGAL
ncbi:MAG: hypothetical protein V4714_20895 [Bacteroidota bacterium]